MKRPLWTVVGLLVLAAVVLWVASLRGGGAGESALAVLALAAVAAALATGGLPRRLLGALVIAVAVVAVPVALGRPALPLALGLAAAVLLAAAGAILLARGHSMPRMGARFERSPGQGGERERPADDRKLWDELDAGRDPTG